MLSWKAANKLVTKVDPSIKWSGPTRPYDLIKELVVAITVVGLLVAGLAFLFSSPDEKAVTIKSWAQSNPVDFVKTATGELAGTTTSASYGPPYNDAGKGQHFGILKMQDWVGVRIPINPAQAFVIEPLKTYNDVTAEDAVKVWNEADARTQSNWANGYADALGKAKDAGMKLYGVSGKVNNPGIFELPLGSTLKELLEELGFMTEYGLYYMYMKK